MRKIFLNIILICYAAVSFSQTVISGAVKSTKNKPISGISITLKDTYDGATTDSSGNFSFKTTEKGQKVLIVTGIGFKTYEENVNLDGTAINSTITLKEEINELKAVIITAGSFE